MLDLEYDLINCKKCSSQQQENIKLTLENQNMAFKVQMLEQNTKDKREDIKSLNNNASSLIKSITRNSNSFVQSNPYGQNFQPQNIFSGISSQTNSSDNKTENSTKALPNSLPNTPQQQQLQYLPPSFPQCQIFIIMVIIIKTVCLQILNLKLIQIRTVPEHTS